MLTAFSVRLSAATTTTAAFGRWACCMRELWSVTNKLTRLLSLVLGRSPMTICLTRSLLSTEPSFFNTCRVESSHENGSNLPASALRSNVPHHPQMYSCRRRAPTWPSWSCIQASVRASRCLGRAIVGLTIPTARAVAPATMRVMRAKSPTPNPSIERTRSGSAGLAFISFWAKPAPPPRAAHVKR